MSAREFAPWRAFHLPLRSFALTAALTAVIGLAAPLSPQALANDVPIRAPLDQVTVFANGAEVTREAAVDIPAGAHTLVLDDLPAGVVTGSIRVEATATGTLTLGNIDTQVLNVTLSDGLDAAARRRLEERLEAIAVETQALSDTIAVAETQKRLMLNLAELPNRPTSGDGASGASLGSAGWSELLTLIGRGMSDANAAVQQAREAQRKLDREAEDLRRQLADQPPRVEQRTQARVSVVAEGPVQAALKLRYRIEAARWSPVYEARVDTGGRASSKAALTLIRRAKIEQWSGEDWDNVALTLSTAQPSRGTDAPILTPLRAVIQEPRPIASRGLSMDAPVAAEAMVEPAMAPAASRMSVGGALARSAPRRAIRTQAAISANAFQATYSITGRTDVATGGREKTVRIDALDAEADLERRVVPASQTTVFLRGQFSVPSERRFLAGELSVFRDGVFLGTGRMPQLSAGSTHALGLGVDDAVRVTFNQLERTSGESGTFSTSKTEVHRFKVGLENGHSEPVSVTVVDRIPVSGDETIVVTPLGVAQKPDDAALDDKPGVMAWTRELTGGAKTELDYGYRIAWPSEKQIRYQ